MRDYYNEFDPHAAQWLRNLIEAGLLPTGDVDERDVRDVAPSDLVGYRRCHFFAGIGIWAYALERAGFEGECWTGSCPCQPFSAAGKGDGFDDERHLWPDWFWLISQCKPRIVFGEQVSGKDALPWFDLVSDDLEGVGYTVGAVDTPAASVGAPHIRQRLYWLAHAECGTAERQRLDVAGPQGEDKSRTEERQWIRADARDGWIADGLAHASDQGPQGRRERPGTSPCKRLARQDGSANGLARTPSIGRGRRGDGDDPRTGGEVQAQGRSAVDGARQGPTNGVFADARWVYCTDGYWRPVGPRALALVDGASGRVGRLRAYGNGLCAPQAEEFVRAAMEAM